MKDKKEPQPLKEGTTTFLLLEVLKMKAITGLELVKDFNILSYNTHIHRLRRKGYVIDTKIETNLKGKRYGVFKLVE